MTRLKPIMLAAAATFVMVTAAPAAAQMDHSNMPGMKMPMPVAKKSAAKKPAAKKPAAKKPVAKKAAAKKIVARKPAARKAPASKPPAAPAVADPMAGHDMSTMPAQPTSPAADPMAGHDMGSMPGMDMPAGHDMSAMPNAAPVGTDLPAGDAPPPPVPTDRAADAVYGAEAQQHGRHHLDKFHGGQKFSQVMFNIAEAQIRNGRDGFEWRSEEHTSELQSPC